VAMGVEVPNHQGRDKGVKLGAEEVAKAMSCVWDIMVNIDEISWRLGLPMKVRMKLWELALDHLLVRRVHFGVSVAT
jgi:hypothetical protein